MKQVILYLSDKSDQGVIDRFNLIASVADSEMTDVVFLYHQKESEVPNIISDLNHYIFTSAVLHNLGYTPLKEDIVPGSVHFPFLKFYIENCQYDYYWLIEDDVCFTGNWKDLFNAYEKNTAGFVSAFITRHCDLMIWPWWSSLNTAGECVRNENKIRSFNPICRLSNAALRCLDAALKQGWIGHHEVVIPTLLYNRGFLLLDMGGTGSFVEKGFENRFYNTHTMSYRPIAAGYQSNYLYHPVKEKKSIGLNALRKNCVIAAVGKKSLHKEWIDRKSDFDLHLIVYDNSFNLFYDTADFITCAKGYKFSLIYHYLHKHPEYIEKYEYFFFPDDDILMNSETIVELFEIAEKKNLQICQPSLVDSYYTYEHTIRDKFCLLRYTNFVEMMIPCFSRDALKKTLPCFNANSSGWGIDFQWADLIGFSGKEMAIIDALPVVHTRPVQSFSKQNVEELDDYLTKNNLSTKIEETGYIVANSQIIGKSNSLAENRPLYILLDALINKIVNKSLWVLDNIENVSVGLSGVTGISLLWMNYYGLSGKKIYLDRALSVIEGNSFRVGEVKNDLNFWSGLPGFTWSIEYLARSGFIENNTNEVLEDIYQYLDDYANENILTIDFSSLISIVSCYSIRLYNNLKNGMCLASQEENMLNDLISEIHRRIKTLENKSVDIQAKDIAHCVLVLSQIRDAKCYPEINLLLKELMILLESSSFWSKSIPYWLRVYLMLVISESLNDEKLKDKIIQNVINKDFCVGLVDFQSLLDMYVLHKLYLHTKENVFKKCAITILHNFVNECRGDSSFITRIIGVQQIENKDINIDTLIRVGLILISILSGKETNLDDCTIII